MAASPSRAGGRTDHRHPRRVMSTASILAELKRKGSRAGVAGMARYGIVATEAYGVSVGDIRALAKTIGRDHALAQKLWNSGVQEGRMLAVFIDDPQLV